MGTHIILRWKGLLLIGLVAFVAISSHASAAGDPLGIPHVRGSPVIDGALDDDLWTDAAAETRTFDGTLREDRTRSVDVRLAHNGTHVIIGLSFTPGGGTHPDDFVALTFYDDEVQDLLRYGWAQPTLLDDKHWNGARWVRDADAGCAIDGAAARQEVDGRWVYEVAKPLSGDACDIDSATGADLRIRIEIRENRPAPEHGDNFRWPVGSTSSDTATWVKVHLDVESSGTADPEPSPSNTDDPDGPGTDDGADPGGVDVTPDRSDRPEDAASGDAAESPAVPVLVVLLAALGVWRQRRTGA